MTAYSQPAMEESRWGEFLLLLGDQRIPEGEKWQAKPTRLDDRGVVQHDQPSKSAFAVRRNVPAMRTGL